MKPFGFVARRDQLGYYPRYKADDDYPDYVHGFAALPMAPADKESHRKGLPRANLTAKRRRGSACEQVGLEQKSQTIICGRALS